MSSRDITDIAKSILVVAAGVIVAGLIMKKTRDSVPLLADASDGFDT